MTPNILADFVAALVGAVGSEPHRVSEIVAAARAASPAADRLAGVLEKLQPGRAKVSRGSLGKTLAKFADQECGGLILRRRFNRHSKQWDFAVLPIGAEFPKQRTRRAKLRNEARREIAARVAEKVERIRHAEAFNEHRADVKAAKAVAAQVFPKPSEADPEPRYMTREQRERSARTTAGTFQGSREHSAPEPAARPSAQHGERRRAPVEVRTGVCAWGIHTQSAELAHRYAHNLPCAGIVAEVRQAGRDVHLFVPCPPSETQKLILAFTRRGFARAR